MERQVDRKTVSDAPKPEKEIATTISVIQKISPDILGLIEMGDETALKDFQTRLQAIGLDYPHFELVQGADPTRHLAVLSRYPIIARNSRQSVPFELHGTQQRISRGILDITVQLTKTQNLRLIGAHLKSRRQVPQFDEKIMRAKEAELLRKHLDSIFAINPQINLLLFGDLNDTKNEYPIKELIGSLKSPTAMRDLPLTDRQGCRWTHFWSTADLYSRIDYLLASRELWPKITMARSGISDAENWFQASDHRAIYAAIQIPEE